MYCNSFAPAAQPPKPRPRIHVIRLTDAALESAALEVVKGIAARAVMQGLAGMFEF